MADCTLCRSRCGVPVVEDVGKRHVCDEAAGTTKAGDPQNSSRIGESESVVTPQEVVARNNVS